MKIRFAPILFFLLSFSQGAVGASQTKVKIVMSKQDIEAGKYVNVVIKYKDGTDFQGDVKVNFNVENRASKPTLEQLKEEFADKYSLKTKDILKMYRKDESGKEIDIRSPDELQNGKSKMIFIQVANKDELQPDKGGDKKPIHNPDKGGKQDPDLLKGLHTGHWVGIVAVILLLVGSLFWFLKSTQKAALPEPWPEEDEKPNKSNKPAEYKKPHFQIGYRWR
ncbi:MAG: hypothetical protein AAF335_02345 [Bacteroidota bacterium]